jgi:hypothetical protein
MLSTFSSAHLVMKRNSTLIFRLILFCFLGLTTPGFSFAASTPTATISGGGNLCSGGVGDTITFTFTGTGPYTFVYSVNGTPQAPITTSQSPYQLYVTPTNYTEYKLVSVSGPMGVGTVSGIAKFFVFVTSNASIPPNMSFCNMADTLLLASVTGTAPFTLTYAINGVLQPPVTVEEGPVPIVVDIDETTIYTLVSVESPGCIRPLFDTTVVTINNPPVLSNLVQNCNPAAASYTVSLNVTNGVPPYSILAGGGSFVGNTYTSAVLPITTGYSIQISDAFNCGNATAAGQTFCSCEANAGTMGSSLLSLCEGDTALAVFNNNASLGQGDTLAFILHTSSVDTAGTVLAWSFSPVFPFIAGISPGVQYYISSVAGKKTANNQVDLTDFCHKVSFGTPVVWNALPTAALGADLAICTGDSLYLNFSLSGTGPFTLSGLLGSQPFQVQNLTAPYQVAAQPSSNGQFILQQLTDSLCSAEVSDTLQYVLHPIPAASLSSACDYQAGTYQITLEVTQGDWASLQVLGLTGAYNAGTGRFVSDPIPLTNPYFFQLADQYACDTLTLQGASPCSCDKNAGVLSGQINPCFGASWSVSPASGVMLGSADGLAYLLTTTNDPATWTIIAQSNTPNFNFIPGQTQAGVTYYLTAVAALLAPGGGLQFSDLCIDYSNSLPVVWKPEVLAVLSGGGTICSGGSQQITVQLFGASTYSYQLFAPGISEQITNTTAAVQSFSYTPTQSTSFALANVIGDGCSGTWVGSAFIQVNPVPVLVDFKQICDTNVLNYQLRFGVTNGAAPNTPYTVTGVNGVFLLDTLYLTALIPEGTPYFVTITSAEGCTTTVSGEGNCECITNAGGLTEVESDACVPGAVSAAPDGNFVLDGNDRFRFLLCTDPNNLPQSVLVDQNNPQFFFGPGLQVETTYFIVAVAGDADLNGPGVNYNSFCLSLTNAIPVRFHNPPTGTMASLDTTVCLGTSLSLPIQFSGKAPFSYIYSVNGIVNPTVVSNQYLTSLVELDVQEDLEFTLLTVSDAYCLGTVTGSARFTVVYPPVLSLSGSGSACAGDSILLTLVLENADSARVQITTDQGSSFWLEGVQGTSFFKVAAQVSTLFQIGNALFFGNDCPGELLGEGALFVGPLGVQTTISNYNGFEVSCAESEDGSILLFPSGGGGEYSFTWSNGSSSELLFDLGVGEYQYTVTDQYGCLQEGAVVLEAPPPMTASYSSDDPTCFSLEDGIINLLSVTGGYGSYTFSVGNFPSVPVLQTPITYDSLPAGVYPVFVKDENNCIEDTLISLNTPPVLLVTLGPDQIIQFGDSILIEGIVNTDTLSGIQWSNPALLTTPNSLVQLVQPIESFNLELIVTDTAGCVGTDDIQVTVIRDERIFIPNVLATEAENQNALFTVYSAGEVRSIVLMQIYDRWGELVFERKNLPPNEPILGWDGRWNNRPVDLGVYVYVVQLEIIDGSIQTRKGDVTVLR